MAKKNKDQDEIHDLIAELSDESKVKDEMRTLATGEYNSREELANTLYMFVENQLQAIQSQEQFRSVVVEEIVDQVKEKKVKIGDLMRLYEIISKQKRDSSTSILNLFKSPQGSGGSIFDSGNDYGDTAEEEYETLTTGERVAIDRLSRLLGSSKLKHN